MKKISIILPVYNAEKYISQTLDSIINQSFSDYELIIIDDGSTDDSSKIINNYRDDRIKYYKNIKNSGIVFSLNRGLEIASSEYIARIDSDDICLKDRLLHQFEFLEANKNVGVCSCNIKYIDASGNEGEIIKMPLSSDETKINFLFGNPIIHPASMFRRELALRVGGYTVGMEPAEDYDFWLKLSEICDIQNINEVLLKYRVHSTNYSKIKRNEYDQKFSAIFKKKNKLKLDEIIENEFLSYHLRLIIGNWSEKSYYNEVIKLKKWKKSLIENNNKLNVFNSKLLVESINHHIILIILSIIKSNKNNIIVKLIAFKILLSFNLKNTYNIIKNRI